MAKLENVKVIDMVNGEVTKIAYDGDEYTKVEGDGKAGDIGLRIKNDASWARIGEYFKVHVDYLTLEYRDNDGDTTEVNPLQWAFFRKVSAPTLTERMDSVEQRVSALEGEKDAKQAEQGAPQAEARYVRVTDRAPKAGDFVKFVEAMEDYLTEKEYYEIDRIDSFGDPQITDDDGDPHDTSGYGYEVYEWVSKAQVIEGTPKVGDKIRIVDVHPLSVRYYDKGDIFTVSRVHPKTSSHRLYVKVKETNENIFREEFEIIERPESNPAKLQVGDYAKVIGNGNKGPANPHDFNYGDIVKLTEYSATKADNGPVFIAEKVGKSGVVYAIATVDVAPATDEEVAEAKRKLNPDLAPGTLVRGNVSGIVELDGRYPINDGPYGKAYNIVGKSSWIGDEQFTVLTDEEAEEHKEIARRAKIDRKPNEIKNGDIVRVTSDVDGHPVGTIGERVNGDMVEANGKRYYHTKGIELVTPVEHRFDKQQ